MPEAGPELSVVCKNCGAEVSPYVTECPYCGTRLRKRAPQLERRGDELTAKETRKTRRERKRREAASERADRAFAAAGRPYVTIVAVVAPAVFAILAAGHVFSIFDGGAISYGGVIVNGDPGAEPWRYLAAPWVAFSPGYLFCTGLAIAIFGRGLERRLGSFALALLLIACGALGMLAAQAFAQAFDTTFLAYGGNGVALGALACWAVLRRSETGVSADDETDWIGVAVIAAVLLLLPLVQDFADPVAGIVGGLVGALAGLGASRFAAASPG